MIKQAQTFDDLEQTGPSTMFGHEPTLGTIEHAIMVDQRLSALQKRTVLENMLRDLNYPSASAPVTPSMLQMLGGGVMGAMLMRLLGSGPGGAALGGIVTLLAQYYLSRPSEPAYTGYPDTKPTYRIM